MWREADGREREREPGAGDCFLSSAPLSKRGDALHMGREASMSSSLERSKAEWWLPAYTKPYKLTVDCSFYQGILYLAADINS